jgi:hypothetical protein
MFDANHLGRFHPFYRPQISEPTDFVRYFPSPYIKVPIKASKDQIHTPLCTVQKFRIFKRQSQQLNTSRPKHVHQTNTQLHTLHTNAWLGFITRFITSYQLPTPISAASKQHHGHSKVPDCDMKPIGAIQSVASPPPAIWSQNVSLYIIKNNITFCCYKHSWVYCICRQNTAVRSKQTYIRYLKQQGVY